MPRSLWIIAGILFVVVGGIQLVSALVLRLDKVRPGRWWGRSAVSAFLIGIGALAYGSAIIVSRVMLGESSISVTVLWGGSLLLSTAILAACFIKTKR
jgi:hypothetical protein